MTRLGLPKCPGCMKPVTEYQALKCLWCGELTHDAYTCAGEADGSWGPTVCLRCLRENGVEGD